MRIRNLVVMLGLAIGLTGCFATRDNAIFVTKTSIGIDVENTPPTASVAYDRVEGFFGPRYDDGHVPPVIGAIFTDGSLSNRSISQIFATGRAAELVTGSQKQIAVPGSTSESTVPKTMFFGTGTTLGLKLGFGDGGVTNTIAFGYKRKEITVIPKTTSGKFPSVLARLDNGTDAAVASKVTFKAKQFFATGIAADNLAPDQASLFQGVAADSFGTYRNSELIQTHLIVNTLNCLANVSDAQLATVWNNAEALNLFSQDTAVYAKIKAAATSTSARAIYTSEIAIDNPDNAEYGALLALHQAFVCRLSGASP